MPASPFTAADLERLAARGIPREEAERQLALLREPPPPRALDRPCVVGDGVERIAEHERTALSEAGRLAAEQGRLSKLVPASGAASRMFRPLVAALGSGWEGSRDSIQKAAEAGNADARALLRFLDEIDAFAFADDLRSELAFEGYDLDLLASSGAGREILEALLGKEGMRYADLPKALLKFHRYGSGARTPLEEHLVEAAATVRDAKGTARVHFTVSDEHVEAFAEKLREVEAAYGRDLSAVFECGFSVQKPSTDTIALTEEGEPFRDEHGALVFRPAGHGALIENLADLGADVVFLKNIDNVVPDRLKGPTLEWKRVLAGYLVTVQRDVFLRVARLRSPAIEPPHLEEAAAFARSRFGIETDPGAGKDDLRKAILDSLERPIRVCGVVVNQGEPGGGPYWARRAAGGSSRQIVESAEVDLDDPGQKTIFQGATHFNPVDLVCGLRDVDGNSFDLHRFVDPSAVFVTTKSYAGRTLRALERPGLWNGAMAFWNTLFVEVPIDTFAPVKTVFDLLRVEHRNGDTTN